MKVSLALLGLTSIALMAEVISRPIEVSSQDRTNQNEGRTSNNGKDMDKKERLLVRFCISFK